VQIHAIFLHSLSRAYTHSLFCIEAETLATGCSVK
jgi:hypothetical protein